MGVGLEVITGQATNPSTTVTAVTPNAGNSLTVRNAPDSADIELLEVWAFTTTNLLARVRSPRMHDVAQNLRFQPTASQPYPLMANESRQVLYPQDPLTVELTGGAAEVDMVSLLVYYNNLPGIDAQLYAWSQIAPLVEALHTVEVDLTSSATSCNYSPTVALNGSFDTFKRNRDYAILGYTCPTTGGTVGITGSDTGNLRIGGPLSNLSHLTNDWFIRLSADNGLPCVPVINSANVGAVTVDCACQAVSTTFKVGFNLALLRTTVS